MDECFSWSLFPISEVRRLDLALRRSSRWSKPAGVLKSPPATIRAQSCPAWAIFQSAGSPSSRPRHGRAETNRSRCHRVFASASRIRLIHAAKPHQCRPLRVSKARYKIHSDPISRMKPELNKANNSVAAQCPTCHATTSFDAHDASVNLQL